MAQKNDENNLKIMYRLIRRQKRSSLPKFLNLIEEKLSDDDDIDSSKKVPGKELCEMLKIYQDPNYFIMK